MNKGKVFLFSLIICFISCVGVYSCIDAKNGDAVVKHSRNVYYKTNKKIKSYTINEENNLCKEYWDLKAKRLKKLITYPSRTEDAIYFKNYTVEYYYDQNQKLVFAFAYRKRKGKIQEYRAYYGNDGKLYRFINSSGEIKDFKNGKKISSVSNSLKYRLYSRGTYYLHLCEEDFA